MTERKNPKIKFVGLHAHSVFSVFDGLGYPSDHMDFAWENGMDAIALTDHGNQNGLSYQVLHAKKMKDAGKEFKPIFGVEAYFHPSVEQWKLQKEEIEQNKKQKEREEVTLTVEDESASKKAEKNILNKRRHLVLLAQNQTGLNNIFTMISKSYKGDNYYRYPRIDYEMLEKYNEGVIASSACLGGVYAGDYWENRENGNEAVITAMRETTQRMKAIFGDRWYAELQWNAIPEQHELNQFVIQVAKEFDVKLLSTADSHYPRPELWLERTVYKKIGWLNVKDADRSLPTTLEEVGYELYPKNGDQMWESYKKYSQQCNHQYDDDTILRSIEESHHIAHSRVENFLPDNSVKLPSFVVPPGKSADEALAQMAEKGLQDKKLKKSVYRERMEYELKVIRENNFSQYFLTMKAISDRANELMLTGPGRGSGAGSLVCYLLGITQADPLRWDLQFERFMRRNQKDYPDIDYDVAEAARLKETLIEEWGSDKVVPITNWNTLQLKSLIKDIAKFYDVPFVEVNAVTSKMMQEATPLAKQRHGIKAGVYTPTFEEVMEFSTSLQEFLDKYPDIKTHVNTLYGQVRSASRHAGGVIITENVDTCMPLINSGGTIQTPWAEGQNVRHLEPMGFIKFDILGLETLAMIESAIYHILKRHKGVKNPSFDDIKEFYNENLHVDKIDFDDKSVYENVFHAGKWAGIFQFTESGAQRFCQRAKPSSIIDISAITSIYRPGPLAADVDKNYVSAKEEPESISYVHKLVKEATESTYGFLVFQEQIATIAHKLGKDISLEEGNQLRKVLTKKGTGKEAQVKQQLFQKFVDGCIEKGIKKQQAEHLWQTFEFFSGYGFNKSHAVCYSIISFQCAWLLNYYPAEWMAAFLDKTSDAQKEKAINIAKSFGFNIKGIDVNTSGDRWEISEDGKTLIQPMTSIKGLGDAAFNEIENYRPFASIEEFLFHEYMSYSKVNKKALDVLCRVGALDSLVDDRFSGLKHFWSVIAVDRPRNEKKFLENLDKYRPEGDFTEQEKIMFLTDLTGLFPINRVLSPEVMQRLEERYIKPLGEYDPELEFVWFIPRNIEVKKTKNGKTYWIVDVIDSSNANNKIRCWSVREKEELLINRPYVARLSYDEQWGFSTRSISKNFRLIG
jgi:DNA polymerase-3 subunit alpha